MPEYNNSGSKVERPDWEDLCQQAEAAGQAFYQDPESGFWVATRRTLFERGYCCEKGCRHCPWKKINTPNSSESP